MTKPRFFDTPDAFEQWLAQNHATAKELLVGFHHKKTGRGISYQQALDAALCFGWIDGVRKRFGDQSYTIRFTPRRPGSIWSAVNVRRARELDAKGLMKPPGLRAFKARDDEKHRRYSYEREQMQMDSSFASALRANGKAAAFFDAQPPGYRKIVTFWIMSAKKEETRARRFALLLERCAESRRIDLLNPTR